MATQGLLRLCLFVWRLVVVILDFGPGRESRSAGFPGSRFGILFLVVGCISPSLFATPGKFVRGDCNRDSDVTITDSLFLGTYLNLEGPTPLCEDACDANDSGDLNIVDVVYILSYLTDAGPPPPPPFPIKGVDPTADDLTCEWEDVPGSWVDTQSNNSMEIDGDLFEPFVLDDQLVVRTTSQQLNIHSHFVTEGSESWRDYEFTGKMRGDAADSGYGVTFLSDYPRSDHYYRFRRYSDNGFHVAPHGTSITIGNPTTGVIPEPGVWYRFRIRVSDTGSQTQILVRVWADGEPEPASWNINCADASSTRRTEGRVGVWTYSNGVKYFGELEVNGDRLSLDDPFHLELEAGDSSLSIGQTTPLSVSRYTTSGREDVSQSAEFTISDPSVLGVNPGASVTGLAAGLAEVEGEVNGYSTNRIVLSVGPEVGEVATSVHRHGITWTFDRAYEVGTFVNGDYWVVGPVTIVSIDPPSIHRAGRIMNGSMINVTPGAQHGWDSALYGPHAGNNYEPHRNVAFGVDPAHPLVVPNGSSLISSISEPAPGHKPGLKSAAVLTVLGSVPPPGTFRPPYAGNQKPLYNISQLRTERLQSYASAGNLPDYAEVAGFFERVWLEHSNYWLVSYQHPSQNMPWYGRDMSWQLGKAALLLNVDRPLAQKELLLHRFIQIGIDFDGLFRIGITWPALGGYMIGRKLPIMFKRHLFGENPDLGNDPTQFSEDDQTYYVLETSPGVINYGYPNAPGYPPYTTAQIGMPEWGHRYWSEDPLGSGSSGHTWFLDGPLWPNGQGHRWCCTARALTGHYLAAYMMGLDDEWSWPAAFDYQDRYMQMAIGSHRGIDSWTEQMWDAHRPGFGGYSPVPSSWIPSDFPAGP